MPLECGSSLPHSKAPRFVFADYIYRQLSIWTDREGTMPPILK